MCKIRGFKKSQRLVRPSEYRRMFLSARSISNQYFVIRYQDSPLNRARLGTAVSKKAVRTSVQRNRLKRIIRETFRIRSLPDRDYVVTVRPAVIKADNRVLISSINELWQELISR